MEWIMDNLFAIALAVLGILQVMQQVKLNRSKTEIARVQNERQELTNQLAIANNNASMFKSLIDVNSKIASSVEKVGERMDKNTDALYINTQLANEKIGKLDDTVGQSVAEQKKVSEHLGKIDKSISQASFDTNSQIEKLGVDIRNLVQSVNEQLGTIKSLVKTRHEAEGETLNRINEITDRFQEDVNNVNELIPLLRKIADKCKEDKKAQSEIKVVPKEETETDNEDKKDIAS